MAHLRLVRTVMLAPLVCAGTGFADTSPLALQTTVVLAPAKDNTIYQDQNSSNGAGTSLFAGNTSVSRARRALVAFDVSTIPSGAVVLSAELRMTVTRTLDASSVLRLHPLTQDWGEAGSNAAGEEGQGAPAQTGDATWSAPFHPSPPWTAQGGDFGAASASTTVLGVGTTATWSGEQLAADVQAWIDGTPNYGWIVIGDESGSETAKRFGSRESGSPPQLVVEYTLPLDPTETPTLAATDTPTVESTDTPTLPATDTPTLAATDTPTVESTDTPIIAPTDTPSETPTVFPTDLPTAPAEVDINGDGVVDRADLLLLIEHWHRQTGGQ